MLLLCRLADRVLGESDNELPSISESCRPVDDVAAEREDSLTDECPKSDPEKGDDGTSFLT